MESCRYKMAGPCCDTRAARSASRTQCITRSDEKRQEQRRGARPALARCWFPRTCTARAAPADPPPESRCKQQQTNDLRRTDCLNEPFRGGRSMWCFDNTRFRQATASCLIDTASKSSGLGRELLPRIGRRVPEGQKKTIQVFVPQRRFPAGRPRIKTWIVQQLELATELAPHAISCILEQYINRASPPSECMKTRRNTRKR